MMVPKSPRVPEPGRPGSGRRPTVAPAMAEIDRRALRAFIDKHDGVVVEMVDDVAGLRACGLLTQGARPLSRVTLSTRLAAVGDFAEESSGRVTAMEYASAARVRAGRPGPRRSATAKRTSAEVAKERRRLIDALAREPTKELAAARMGLATRRSVKLLAEELGVTEADVQRRRRQILTCSGCRDEGATHACGREAPAMS